MLTWIFGDVEKVEISMQNNETAIGKLYLEKARINWLLSIDYDVIPEEIKALGKRTYRTLNIEGQELEFSDGFTELHTESYRNILDGNGFGLVDCRKAIEIVSKIRSL
jgi:UDP-N-acetyl-2-amino-2-deoxyglucuronate dehydrogenase